MNSIQIVELALWTRQTLAYCTRTVRGGFHRLLHEDGGATVTVSKKIPDSCKIYTNRKLMLCTTRIHHQFIITSANRTKTLMHSKLQFKITQSILHHFQKYLYQHAQREKLYINMAKEWRIKRFENLTSWRAVTEIKRFKALQVCRSNPEMILWSLMYELKLGDAWI